MDVISMAMAKPKVIDLDQYKDGEYSITNVLLQLFANGGGYTDIVSDFGLFFDLNIKRAIQIQFTFSLGTTAIVNTANVTRILHPDGGVDQLCFECTIDMNGAIYRTSVTIVGLKDKDGMRITLKLETL